MFNTNVLHSYIWVVILHIFMLFLSQYIIIIFILYIIPVKVKKTIACSINGDLQCYLQGTFWAKNSTFSSLTVLIVRTALLLLALNFGDL